MKRRHVRSERRNRLARIRARRAARHLRAAFAWAEVGRAAWVAAQAIASALSGPWPPVGHYSVGDPPEAT